MALKRHRFAQRRRAVGYNQEQLAEELDIDRSTVSRWERVETDPLPFIRPKLARVLKVSLEDLDELLDDVVTVQPQREERLDHVLNNPTSVDLMTAAYFCQRVQTLNDAYDQAPSALLLAAAGQCHGQVAYLREHAPNGRVRRELWGVESESATLMGQLVWDASQRRDHATTLAYFDQAVAAARQVRDLVGEAHAQLRKGYVALYGKHDPHEALALTKSAASTSKGASHALTGLALLHVGEAYAMLGEYSRCEKALSSAESQFGRVDADDAAIELFSPTQFGRLAGSCYLFLGDAERATTILEETAQELQRWKKSRAIVLGNLSLAYIRQRKLDEAIGKLHQAIDVVEETRGAGGLNIIFTAGRELRRWQHEPAVQDVNDRLLALMAA
jgi:transcriptional regulator with XRE-family HTH domain